MVCHRDWTSDTLSEEDFGTSTKADRQINELEYGDCSKSVSGHSIDLVVAAPIVNDCHREVLVELSAMEIKPAAVTTNVEAVQLNKNIRVNKSILHQIHSHTGNVAVDDLSVLDVDVIGLSAYIHRVKQYEDVAVACKVSEENIFLPADEEDFDAFLHDTYSDRAL
ncbi:hypothetical protein FB192DRAFT_1470524 [Mucor lusitanicus]|uniref:Uncharacterized protein n=1 Tax=Mucor circinelloides f. lusitanicus TaxID=29924 RepID=A0A8H4BKF1_MUCCL|nr:hypothetical protein FB192DRAFT_1470524 [Mucor lusitanicus]